MILVSINYNYYPLSLQHQGWIWSGKQGYSVYSTWLVFFIESHFPGLVIPTRGINPPSCSPQADIQTEQTGGFDCVPSVVFIEPYSSSVFHLFSGCQSFFCFLFIKLFLHFAFASFLFATTRNTEHGWNESCYDCLAWQSYNLYLSVFEAIAMQWITMTPETAELKPTLF